MTGVLTFDACFPDSVVGFTSGDFVKVEYIQTVLNLMQKQIEERAPQAAQRNINLKILRELNFPVPALDLQTLYAKIVASARGIAATAETASDTTSALSASLMVRLFGDNA